MRFPPAPVPVILAAALAAGCGGDAVIPLPGKFTAVSAGVLHSCGIVGDGGAYCWGSNTEGQLGDGSRSLRTTPAPVIGELRFTALSAGGEHTCGLTSGGRVHCWGLNLSGQLGDGTSANHATPAPVVGIATFVSISAGGEYSCGVGTGGQAYCWGWNEGGQLGDGTIIPRSSPTVVSGDLTFGDIVAGVSHTCGLTVAGEVYCWGQNTAGQLGNDQVTAESAPVKVASSEVFTSVDAGYYHTCAVAADGKGYCWGRNDFGQLGLGKDAGGRSQLTPVEVTGDRRFFSLSTGAVFTCAIERGTGSGYCWGFNGSGQLGSESPDRCGNEGGTTSPCTLEPKEVSGGLSFASISAHTQHVCGITTDGVAYCWGLGSHGQLGDGSKGETVFSLQPVRVAGQP